MSRRDQAARAAQSAKGYNRAASVGGITPHITPDAPPPGTPIVTVNPLDPSDGLLRLVITLCPDGNGGIDFVFSPYNLPEIGTDRIAATIMTKAQEAFTNRLLSLIPTSVVPYPPAPAAATPEMPEESEAADAAAVAD